jgi:hypothetical protein
MVYHAGVKTGYDTSCPSCYADCGKRVITDDKGEFHIPSLAPDLWFELLAVRDGYIAEFAKKVDPTIDPTVTITLSNRAAPKDFSSTVRGRVVDSSGSPVRDAVVQPIGLLFILSDKHAVGYGSFEGLEPTAVTNRDGDFELSYTKPTPKMLLKIEARGMAEKYVAMDTGPDRHPVTVDTGAAITGRLVANGKPVANAEIGLIPKRRHIFGVNPTASGDPYSEITVGTKPDGTFTIPNVPEPVDWYLYMKMGSLPQGAAVPVEVKTTEENQFLHAPDLVIEKGYRLNGKVQLSDKSPIPDGMRIRIGSEKVWDSQTTTLPPDGHFEFTNLPAGSYSIEPSVKGYELKKVPGQPADFRVSVDHDIDSVTVPLVPSVPSPSRVPKSINSTSP